MAQPAIPTATSLVVEGLRQARIFNPTQQQINTYQNEVMEQLKNDLWANLRQPFPLQTFSYAVLTPGQSRYSCPADFASDMTMVVLTGLITGTALAGTMTTITLPASVGPLDPDQTLGKDIIIMGGTASSSASQIVGVVTNTDGSQLISVYPSFQATPDGSSQFMIVDNQYPVDGDHIANYDRFRSSGLDRPRKFYLMGDENYGEFIFDVPPDATFQYAIRMTYFVNVMTLDLTSPLMSTLYLKFREYWIKGIKAQALSDNDDEEADDARGEWKQKLQDLIMSQQYGVDIHKLTEHVADYY